MKLLILLILIIVSVILIGLFYKPEKVEITPLEEKQVEVMPDSLENYDCENCKG